MLLARARWRVGNASPTLGPACPHAWRLAPAPWLPPFAPSAVVATEGGWGIRPSWPPSTPLRMPLAPPRHPHAQGSSPSPLPRARAELGWRCVPRPAAQLSLCARAIWCRQVACNAKALPSRAASDAEQSRQAKGVRCALPTRRALLRAQWG